jgi:glutaminyl-tRNA synthetase
MGVLRPLKLTITNYPQGKFEDIECENNPEDPSAGTRPVPFGRELWIEADDFREDAPKKWFRLAPGAEVRLKHAYLIVCNEVVKNDAGEVIELRCTYDPKTRGGEAPDGRKVRGTLHWVSVVHAISAEMRMYDKLYLDEFPEDGEGDFLERLNPKSLEVLRDAKLEPAVAKAQPGFRCQLFRHGYFCVDPDSQPERLVFNFTIGLRDSWAKLEKKLES